jgi:hypothetical protein
MLRGGRYALLIKRGMLSLLPRIYFVLMLPFFSAGETTAGENGNFKIIWGNFDILEVAMARSVGYAK